MTAAIPGDRFYFGITILVTLIYQFSFFLLAATCKFDKVTDLAGGSNFFVLSVLTWSLSGATTPRHLILNILAIAWSVRLAGFLFYRIMHMENDHRFDKMRENWLEFGVFWIFQFLWVWLVSLPVIYVNSQSSGPSLNYSDIVGLVLATIGLLIEAIADQTKYNFKNHSENADKWCDIGIWRYSRHPNYFGEICFWWGQFIVASRVLLRTPWSYFTIISPVFTTLILLGFSGMPILEEKANRKFGARTDYVTYRKETSILIPLPRSLYGATPHCVKSVLLFEWPLYAKNLTESHTEELAPA